MTKDELWAVYIGKNPIFKNLDAQISITGRNLKKLFDQTYDIAHKQGVLNGRALAEMNSKPASDFEKIFGGIFGGK